jgi:hypothetical protein
MTTAYQVQRLFFLSFLVIFLTACSTGSKTGISSKTASKPVLVNDKDFPYHPLVFHLDLSTLAYHLYGQSLVWPFDPYYEEMGDERDFYMSKVKAWAKHQGKKQLAKSNTDIDVYRGPGSLAGFANNPLHDPILYNYGLIHPWSDNITNADNRWTEYLTPREITDEIKEVYVSYRATGDAKEQISLMKITPQRNPSVINRVSNKKTKLGEDVLLAFEGGTGDKNESGQPASQSLMGFVLLRNKVNGHYDVHIAFRGSRSGKVGRAALQALSGSSAAGNPDWITDLGYDRVGIELGAGDITTISKVSRGFALSMKSIFPQLFHNLKKVSELKGGTRPDNIYVTGHSLGGGLAQHFVSSVLMGNHYSASSNSAMPKSVSNWPWQQIKLITYSAPRAGNKEWAKVLSTKLQSEFFSSLLNPIDRKALAVTHPTIMPRLVDIKRPAGYRVLISSDPITSEKVPGGGNHVGKTIYVNKPSLFDSFIPKPNSHEPENVRQFMLDSFGDKRTPTIAMRYREMSEIAPDYSLNKNESISGLTTLGSAVKSYYSNKGMWFDESTFDKDLATRLEIYRAK